MKPDARHVLVAVIQKRGNLGKSTTLAGIGQWLEQRNVSWQGFDFDGDHQSFSRLFPGTAALCPIGDEPESDIIKALRRATSAPVSVLDPRAHLSPAILRAMEMTRFVESFGEAGGRICVLLFPADDLEVLTDIDATVSCLQNRVDYLIVRNPARAPRTRMFDGSALESDLLGLGAATLDMPVLLSLARNHLAALEAELERGITQLEAAANRQLPLDMMVRMILEDWCRTLFGRLDRVGAKLLPDEWSARITQADRPTSTTAPVRRGGKINRDNL